MDGQEPDADVPGLRAVDASGDGKFRFTSSKVFLTYSQADAIDRSTIITTLEALGYHKIYGGQEQHQDGGKHFHVLAWSSKKKIDIKNPRYWDIGGVHPNVRNVRSTEAAIAYLSKDGDTFVHGNPDILTEGGKIKGFRSFKADFEEFKRHVRSKHQVSPFPLELPFFTLREPTKQQRQRCLYVWGPPDSGKTRYFTERLDGKSTYAAGFGELEFDTYGEELCVLYDDHLPLLSTLICLLNYSEVDKPCPGRQRYYQRFLRGRQARFVVIIMNRLVPWENGCTNSSQCNCPGCTRCIYYNWFKYGVSVVSQGNIRIDLS